MKLIIKGIVQGVGFRPTVAKIAKKLNLHGYVRNMGSYVEIFIEEDELVEEFLKILKESLPPIAHISEVIIRKEFPEESYDGFEIKKSKDAERFSIIPPDTAICEDCLKELFDKNNRRYLYPFTNCTKCGARFSIIEDLPYDRERTTMKYFPMCKACLNEYYDLNNRRYDAQTISCPECGPKMYIIDKNGKKLDVNDPIKVFAKAIDKGLIGVIKGWGGYHVVCKLSSVPRLRDLYNRPTKPFAIMFRDINTIKKYAYVSKVEEDLLLSSIRPIVLLRKKVFDKDLEYTSPGLPYIGAYLPYSAIQHILFHFLKTDAIVMTSGNLPGKPMAINDDEALKLPADIYLSHNRPIANRIDDSVVKVYKKNTFIIRRSRGYVPISFPVNYPYKILSVGAELNITFTVSKEGYMYPSQHIGDGTDFDVIIFLQNAVEKFKKLLKIENFDAVAADLHPKYSTRAYAERFHENIYLIQHHHAHAASLLFDAGIENGIFLTFDGTGYGPDDTIWGGELLYATSTTYERLCSLKPIPLPGGEKAIWNPELIYKAILNEVGDPQEDIDSLIRISPRTSSMGRLLDALSYALGVCSKATYDGEPAMKLECLLLKGEGRPFEIETTREDGIIRIDPYEYFLDIPKLKSLKEKADFAYRLIGGIIKSFIDIAENFAEKYDTRYLGFTGGVSYNIPMTDMFERFAKEYNLIPVMHHSIPNGDAGISIGQNYIVGNMILKGVAKNPIE